MNRERCLRSTQKALERGLPKQRRGAAEAYLSVSKTLDSREGTWSIEPAFSDGGGS